MEPVPFFYDERGPLAFTHSSDGMVLPFAEVACDKVRSSVNSALWGAQRKNSAMLFGRALGRVLAHEIYHVRAKTTHHSSRGVAKNRLSGAQLIADDLGFDEPAQEAMRGH